MRADLGLPRLRGNGLFVAALGVDSVGSGLLLAFQVLYFVEVLGIDAAQVGAALSVALGLTAATPFLAGGLLETSGPRRTAVVGNVVSALGFAGFLLVSDVWHVVVTMALVNVGACLFWTASPALVAVAAAAADQRIRWFAFANGLRNAGIGAGAAIGSLVVAIGGDAGITAVIVADAASFLVCAVLLSVWRAGTVDRRPVRDGRPGLRGTGYRAALVDAPFLRAVVLNGLFALYSTTPGLLLALWVARELPEAGRAFAGVLIVVNTMVIVVLQAPAARVMERARPYRVIAVGFGVGAAAMVGLAAAPAARSVGAAMAFVLLAVVVFTVAEIVLNPSVAELGDALTPTGVGEGAYRTVFQLSWTVSGMIAPVLLFGLLDRGAALPWSVLAGLCAAASALAASAPRRGATGGSA